MIIDQLQNELPRVMETLSPGYIFRANESFYCVVDRCFNVRETDNCERIGLNLANGIITHFDSLMTVTWYPNARLKLE